MSEIEHPVELTSVKPAVLVADRHRSTRQQYQKTFPSSKFTLSMATDTEDICQQLSSSLANQPDALVMEPLGFTNEERTRIFEARRSTFILVFTADSRKEAPLEYLVVGADDVIRKTLNFRPLVAKIRALITKAYLYPHIKEDVQPLIIAGDTVIDFNRHMVFVGGNRVLLTPKEYLVLQLLGQNLNSEVSYSDFFEKAGYDYHTTVVYVNRFVNSLRHKLISNSGNPAVIETIPKVGLKLIGKHTPQLDLSGV